MVSNLLLVACGTTPRYDTRRSTCLVLPSCQAYSKGFKSSLADEIERNQDNALQVQTIIDYDMICKKLDIAHEDMEC
jgi:hypothetical protein